MPGLVPVVTQVFRAVIAPTYCDEGEVAVPRSVGRRRRVARRLDEQLEQPAAAALIGHPAGEDSLVLRDHQRVIDGVHGHRLVGNAPVGLPSLPAALRADLSAPGAPYVCNVCA